jgi:hypothetical protein
MRRAVLPAVLAVLLALAAGACGDDASRTSTGPGRPGPRGDAVAIRISVGGGFSPQGLDFASVPTVVLHDGTVLTGGAITLQFPGPAVLPVVTGRLDQHAVDELLGAAREAGLDGSPDYGTPGVTDLASTTVQVDLDGELHEVSAYALGFEEGDSSAGAGLTAGQRAARAELQAFVQRVSDAATAAATEPYAPAAYQVEAYEAGPVDPSADPPLPNELDWPLAEPLVAGRCLEVAGADADALARALEQATSITRWHSGEQVLTIAVKTVLPGTDPCPAA